MVQGRRFLVVSTTGARDGPETYAGGGLSSTESASEAAPSSPPAVITAETVSEGVDSVTVIDEDAMEGGRV